MAEMKGEVENLEAKCGNWHPFSKTGSNLDAEEGQERVHERNGRA